MINIKEKDKSYLYFISDNTKELEEVKKHFKVVMENIIYNGLPAIVVRKSI